MGDRCYVQVTLRKEDFEQHGLEKYFGDGILSETEGVVVVAEAEANYGYENELREWADKGIAFHGCHGVGGDYGPHLFASDGTGEYIAVPTDFDDDRPIVGVNSDGSIDEGQMETATKYWSIYQRAKSRVEGVGSGP